MWVFSSSVAVQLDKCIAIIVDDEVNELDFWFIYENGKEDYILMSGISARDALTNIHRAIGEGATRVDLSHLELTRMARG